MVFQEHKKCWKIWGRGSPSARYKQSLHCLLGSSTHFVNTLWLFYSLCDYSTHFVFFLECTPRIWCWLFCSHLPCVHCTVFCVNIFLTFNHTYVVETIFRVGQQKCVIQILNEINFHRDTNTAQRQIHPQIEIQVQWGSASSSSMVLSQMSQTRRAAAPSLNIFPLTINLICLEYFSD